MLFVSEVKHLEGTQASPVAYANLRRYQDLDD